MPGTSPKNLEPDAAAPELSPQEEMEIAARTIAVAAAKSRVVFIIMVDY